MVGEEPCRLELGPGRAEHVGDRSKPRQRAAELLPGGRMPRRLFQGGAGPAPAQAPATDTLKTRERRQHEVEASARLTEDGVRGTGTSRNSSSPRTCGAMSSGVD